MMKNCKHNKLLVLSYDLPPRGGGIGRYTQDLVNQWAESGVHILLIGAPEVADPTLFEGHRIRIRLVKRGAMRSFSFWRLFLMLPWLVYKEKVEKVFITNWTPYGICGVWVKILTGVPYFVASHGKELMAETCPSGIHRALRKTVFRGAEKVFTISGFTRDLLLNLKVFDRKILQIPNGINLRRVSNVMNDGLVYDSGFRGKRVILTVARLDMHKGHDKVIEALPLLLQEFPDIHYVVCGEGVLKESLGLLVHERGLDQHVTFLGFTADSMLSSLYSLAEIFVMVSRNENGCVEGFGLSFLEAAAAGKPVIGGNSGGIPDAVIHGETGFLVDPLSTTDIAERIGLLLRDTALATRLGRQGRIRLENKLDIKLIAGKYLQQIFDSKFIKRN